MTKTILLVEDEAEQSALVKKSLENTGYRVLLAQTGQEALNLTQEELPDLILLDIIMPEMDGLIFLKKFKERPGANAVPVIVFSNLNSKQELEQAMESGASDYLIKVDWSIKDLKEKIHQFLGE